MIGYDKVPWNFGLVLDMPFEEATGDMAYDRSRCGHQMVLHNTPTWTQILPSDLTVLDFDPTTPEWLDASAADTNICMNFTTQDFSIAAWVRPDDLSANRSILCRGLLDTDGYHCQVLINGTLILYTSQGGLHQLSASAAGEIVVDNWYMVGFTRASEVVTIYKNGFDVTDVSGVHINPLTCARELHIGIYDNEIGSPWAGMMWRPRVWRSRAVPAYEWKMMFELERGLFGV